MPTIFDNSETSTLGGSLLKTFPEHKRIDVATGYFDLRGWGTFTDLVDEKQADGASGPVARILVGMVAPSAAEAMLQDLQEQVQAPDPNAHIPDFESARTRQ